MLSVGSHEVEVHDAIVQVFAFLEAEDVLDGDHEVQLAAGRLVGQQPAAKQSIIVTAYQSYMYMYSSKCLYLLKTSYKCLVPVCKFIHTTSCT